ncbi:hypothetical protein CYMTET_16147 [Cymbomonas tetramitiformis]|uniref:Uncharacterized protein n=1 Tax=Cymbomonas tetramitiformis TaxID=36881 RepID=A0AAE0GE19_9CHLO|nr:hypothetical protein CYMTET_16147 [Cymbomonas tetramitiformis]
MLHTIGVDSPVVIRCAASVNPALVFSWKLETIAEAANASTTNRTMKAALTEFCGYKSIDDFDTIDRAYFTTTASMPSRQMAVDEYIRVCIDQAQGLYMRDVDRVVRGHDDAELVAESHGASHLLLGGVRVSITDSEAIELASLEWKRRKVVEQANGISPWRKDFKKKEPSTPAGEDANKRPPREANNAERAKSSYNKVPPPDAKNDKQCKYCFTQMWHSAGRCFTGSRDAQVPPDFHKKRLNSRYENEVHTAKMREYNLKHMFPKHKMGITTEEWLKLPEAKQQRAAVSAEVQDRLAAELSYMQTAGQAGGGKGAEAQALSDGEEDEAEYDSNFNEREEYAAEEHVGSAGEEEVTGDHSEASSMPDLQARAAIALLVRLMLHLLKVDYGGT